MKPKASDNALFAALLLGVAVLLFCGAAMIVFQIRNPTANNAACWREIGAVLRFEKLARYQGNEE
jgi:hypothetical protein